MQYSYISALFSTCSERSLGVFVTPYSPRIASAGQGTTQENVGNIYSQKHTIAPVCGAWIGVQVQYSSPGDYERRAGMHERRTYE